jgi:hypothetical protein
VFNELCAVKPIGSFGGALPDLEIIEELDKLLLRPSFTRIWVLQEVYMAKSVRIQCGRAYAPLYVLSRCVWGYNDSTRITTGNVPFALRMDFYRHEYALPTECNSAECLWEVLAKTRHLLATDPRDRIFALRAFLPHESQPLGQMISYDQNTETIFTAAAVFLRPHIGPSLLLATRHPHSLNMPSWVPDWSENTSTHIAWGIRRPFDDDSDRSIESHDENALEEHDGAYLGKNLRVRAGQCGDGSCEDSHIVLYVKGVRHSCIATLGVYSTSKKQKIYVSTRFNK